MTNAKLWGVLLAGTAVLGFAACGGGDDDEAGASGDDDGDGGGSSGVASSGGGGTSSSGAAASSSGAGGSSGIGSSSGSPPNVAPGAACSGAARSAAADETDVPALPASLKVPDGFVLEAIGQLGGPRHVVALPNGDLLVGSSGHDVYLVPHADGEHAGAPSTFVSIDDGSVNGVAFDAPNCTVYAATEHGVYKMAYADGQTTAEAGQPIALVRQSSAGGHSTSSIAVAGDSLFLGVGSSCNSCVESDPTRATVQKMGLDGSNMTTYARRIRNPIAVTTNPASGAVWVGVAGQDDLPVGHPYEFFDHLTAHPSGTDYGWPDCEENHVNYSGKPETDCSATAVPQVEMPAFSTLIAAAVYPPGQGGAHAFPEAYRGGAFIAAHGSWHEVDGKKYTPPRVAFVKLNGDAPVTPVDWNDPSTQWSEFISGMQLEDGQTRVARAAGAAVGYDGSLYVTDDQAGYLLRVRPKP